MNSHLIQLHHLKVKVADTKLIREKCQIGRTEAIYKAEAYVYLHLHYFLCNLQLPGVHL